jgi:hypothetical protein
MHNQKIHGKKRFWKGQSEHICVSNQPISRSQKIRVTVSDLAKKKRMGRKKILTSHRGFRCRRSGEDGAAPSRGWRLPAGERGVSLLLSPVSTRAEVLTATCLAYQNSTSH